MATRRTDPTDPLRRRAVRYPDVDEGTACTQSSFKVGGKSFLFVGEQGGRSKAMFKLDASLPEARRLAKKQPDRYGVGSTGWVTARFTADEPMPKTVWEKWLDESYALSRPASKKKAAGKKTTKKKSAKKKSAKKPVTKKKSTKKTTTRRTKR